MKRTNRIAAICAMSLLSLPVGAVKAEAASKSNCASIVQELLNQGASDYVATRLGRTIAWREGRCLSVPKCVSDKDDLSCSRFGINFRTSNLRRGWKRLCGATHYTHLRNLELDVSCALAAYRAMGFRPWR